MEFAEVRCDASEKTYHALKSPGWSCISITLPASSHTPHSVMCVAAGRLVRRTTGHRTAAQQKLDRRYDDEMTDSRITLVKVFGENIHAG